MRWAARAAFPGRRLVAAFQPHLFSRTRDFAREFGEALRVADVSIVTPIYAAREKPIEGVSARLISDAVKGVEFLDRSTKADYEMVGVDISDEALALAAENKARLHAGNVRLLKSEAAGMGVGLGLVALGLVGYGIYQLVEARYRRIQPA